MPNYSSSHCLALGSDTISQVKLLAFLATLLTTASLANSANSADTKAESGSSIEKLRSSGVNPDGSGSYIYFTAPDKWIVQFKDSQGNILRQWNGPGFALHSTNGRAVAIIGYRASNDGREFQDVEVFSSEGSRIWQATGVSCCGQFSASDSGNLLQFPFEGGKEFSYFDSRGIRYSQQFDSRLQDSGHRIAWSPNGKSVSIASSDRRTLRCINPKGKLAFKIDFAGEFRLLQHAIWDDCQAVGAFRPRVATSTLTAHVSTFDSNGNELRRRPFNGDVYGNVPIQISPDSLSFLLVSDNGSFLRVFPRDLTNQTYEYHLADAFITHASFLNQTEEILIGERLLSPKRLMGSSLIPRQSENFKFRVGGKKHPKPSLVWEGGNPAALRFDRKSRKLLSIERQRVSSIGDYP